MNTILVTGATGQQGGALVQKLIEKGHRVRAMSRTMDKLKPLKDQGVEIVVGDLHDRPSLVHALEDIKQAFLVTTPFEGGMDAEVHQGINFIEACKGAGVEHLVFTSVCASDKNTGIPHFETKWEVEQHLQQCGLPYTILRPVFFMENFGSDWFLPSIQKGKLVLPIREDVKIQMIPLEVIADFATAAFERPKEFVGKTLELVSDELTLPQAIQMISDVTGKTIIYDVLPPEKAEEVFGADFTRMLRWLNDDGFTGTVKNLEKWEIHLTTFKEHLSKAQWVKKIEESKKP